jgi:hypothetical protein
MPSPGCTMFCGRFTPGLPLSLSFSTQYANGELTYDDDGGGDTVSDGLGLPRPPQPTSSRVHANLMVDS